MQNLFETRFNDIINKTTPIEKKTRQGAFEFFKNQGLPTRKDEQWKYTNVSFVGKEEWNEPGKPLTGYLDKINQEKVAGFHHLVFLNGVFQPEISDQVEGLKVSQKVLDTDKFDNSITALNWSLTKAPIVIHVDKDVKISKPVQVLHYSGSETHAMSLPHIDVQLEEGSCLCLAEHFFGEGVSATNSFTNFRIGKEARLTYVQVQEQDKQAYHLAHSNYEVLEGAHVETLSFTTGASLSRHTQNYSLVQPHSHVRTMGLYAVSGSQHTDHTGLIDHIVGECTSYQIFKGLLADQSRAVFNGRVYIRPNSQKAFSEQVNKNLLLSTGAEIDSKPQLEIYADDVQARHGSTVGQINKEELFYLNSRAIPTAKALPLLSFGFLSEILYQLSEEKLIQWLKPKLEKALVEIKAESL